MCKMNLKFEMSLKLQTISPFSDKIGDFMFKLVVNILKRKDLALDLPSVCH